MEMDDWRAAWAVFRLSFKEYGAQRRTCRKTLAPIESKHLAYTE